MQLTITIRNELDGLEQMLERLSPRGRYTLNMSIAEEMLNFTRDNFKSGTDPYGDKWQPLKPSTLKTEIREGRLRQDYGHTPLRVTNNLMQSFNRRSSNQDAAIISTPVAYGRYHQSDEPRKKIPQRLFFPTQARGLPEKYWTAIREVIDDHLGGS